jgi:hypothetical protein
MAFEKLHCAFVLLCRRSGLKSTEIAATTSLWIDLA